ESGDGAYDVYDDDEPAPKRASSRAAGAKSGGRSAAGTAKRGGAAAPRARRKPGRIRGTIEALRRGWANPRTRAVWGLVTWTVAAFLMGSLVSGLISGAEDYELVTEGVRVDGEGEATPYHNWLGGAGAHVAFWLGRQGLGMGALALPVWLVLLGWSWLWGRPPAAGAAVGGFAGLGLVMLPWAIAFTGHLMGTLGDPAWDPWVGASGHWLLKTGLHYLGNVGTALVILLVGGGIAVYYAQPVLAEAPSGWSLRNWFRRSPSPEEDEEAGEWGEEEEDTWENPGDALRQAAGWGRNTTPAADPAAEAPPVAKPPQTPAASEPRNTRTAPPMMGGDETWPTAPSPEPELQTKPQAQPDPLDQLFDDLQDDHFEEDPEPEGGTRLEGMGFEVRLASSDTLLSEDQIEQRIQELGEYDPTLDLARYEFPRIDLLQNHGDGKVRVTKTELEANKNRIIDTLRHFSIEVSSIKAEVGPTVTLYEIVPAPGIRISKIKNLEDDIALSLSALGIRIIAPIPGRGTIGIEVPNSNPDVVSMKALIASDKFQSADAALPVAIGKTISNETYVFDLAKMPHLLMAGATGQGKSVGLNAILVSLLYRKHPAQLKFVLVDPKKVELTLFNLIERHYLAKLPNSEDAIITDTSKVVATLNSLCIEMDQRYDLLKDAQCRNLKEYNAKFVQRRLLPTEGHRYLPYIVLVVDEFADLIMTAGKEVETPIARLAQLARAIGIHLIIATQRPSVNIITGTIKANFPARIAFRVTSKIDSRTILDAGGADQLIGRGDLLLSTGNDLIRIQCGFVDTPEVQSICEFIGSQQGYPDAFLLPEYNEEEGGSEGAAFDDGERDPMFEEAARTLVLHQQGSTSLLQRKLKLGYNRAGRIMDQLEHAGIIGPFEGSKARRVLFPDEASLEQYLRSQGN
ncbi:MAG: Stage sporulation protein, partial [Bacteroidota bacterium]